MEEGGPGGAGQVARWWMGGLACTVDAVALGGLKQVDSVVPPRYEVGLAVGLVAYGMDIPVLIHRIAPGCPLPRIPSRLTPKYSTRTTCAMTRAPAPTPSARGPVAPTTGPSEPLLSC